MYWYGGGFEVRNQTLSFVFDAQISHEGCHWLEPRRFPTAIEFKTTHRVPGNIQLKAVIYST
jgi:hypothetical protein